MLFQLRRPRRHSVSSLSTQGEFTEDTEDTADMDRNNCNTHVNSGDSWTTTNSPSQPSGHGRTTIPEDLTHASSPALRHSGHGPLHTRVDLSVTGHALLPNGGVLANTNYSLHDTDDDSDDSQATIEDSVGVPRTNGWPSHGVNESVQCSMRDDGVARTAQDAGMDINTDHPSHTVATQYNSPGQQHRHRNHDRIVNYQQQVDRGQHVQWVADDCPNTERMDNFPTQHLTNDTRTRPETSGSDSDTSTRRVLFPDSGTRHHDHSPGARYPFHPPQFDNFSETGSYSPPRERPQSRRDSWGQEHDPSTSRGRRDPHDDKGRRDPHDDRWRRDPHDDKGRRDPHDDRGRRDPHDDRGRRDPHDDRGRRDPHDGGEGTLMMTGGEGTLMMTGGEGTLMMTGGEGTLMMTGGEGTLMMTGGEGTLMMTGGEGTLMMTGQGGRESVMPPVPGNATLLVPAVNGSRDMTLLLPGIT